LFIGIALILVLIFALVYGLLSLLPVFMWHLTSLVAALMALSGLVRLARGSFFQEIPSSKAGRQLPWAVCILSLLPAAVIPVTWHFYAVGELLFQRVALRIALWCLFLSLVYLVLLVQCIARRKQSRGRRLILLSVVAGLANFNCFLFHILYGAKISPWHYVAWLREGAAGIR